MASTAMDVPCQDDLGLSENGAHCHFDAICIYNYIYSIIYIICIYSIIYIVGNLIDYD